MFLYSFSSDLGSKIDENKGAGEQGIKKPRIRGPAGMREAIKPVLAREREARENAKKGEHVQSRNQNVGERESKSKDGNLEAYQL